MGFSLPLSLSLAVLCVCVPPRVPACLRALPPARGRAQGQAKASSSRNLLVAWKSWIYRSSQDRSPLQSTPVGFEPTRGDPIGLAGRRLSRSAKVSLGAGRLLFYIRVQWTHWAKARACGKAAEHGGGDIKNENVSAFMFVSFPLSPGSPMLRRSPLGKAACLSLVLSVAQAARVVFGPSPRLFVCLCEQTQSLCLSRSRSRSRSRSLSLYRFVCSCWALRTGRGG